jgi:uncharacterized repeat protein (TIGR01451 family)
MKKHSLWFSFLRAFLAVCMIFQSVFPGWFWWHSSVAAANAWAPSDVWITKTGTGNFNPWGIVTYTLRYGNNTGSGPLTTWLIISDTYWSGLLFSGIISANPALTWTFVHNPAIQTLTWSGTQLPTNTTGEIKMQFQVSPSVTYDSSIMNDAHIEKSCDILMNPVTVTNTKSSTFSVAATSIPNVPYTPTSYDLGITKQEVSCATWLSIVQEYVKWQNACFKLSFSNNGTTQVDNIVFLDNYSTSLLQYVGVTTNTPNIPATPSNTKPWFVSFSQWFSLAAGETGSVVLQFSLLDDHKMIIPNRAQVWVLPNVSNLGKPLSWNPTGADILSSTGVVDPMYGRTFNSEYPGAPFISAVWNNGWVNLTEVDTNNNISQATIATPPFDLAINKTLVAGTEAAWEIVTYRLAIYNSGHARNDIAVTDIPDYNTWKYLSWSSPLTIDNPPTLAGGNNISPLTPAWVWRPYRPVSDYNLLSALTWHNIHVWANSTWYIDVTVELPEYEPWCSTGSVSMTNRAYVSLTDNTVANKQLWTPIYQTEKNSWDPAYIWWASDIFHMTNTRETTQSNNRSTKSITIPVYPTRSDCVASPYDFSITKSVDKNLVYTGDEVTYTLNLYNSWTTFKYAFLGDFIDPGMQLTSIIYDTGDRYIETLAMPIQQETIKKFHTLPSTMYASQVATMMTIAGTWCAPMLASWGTARTVYETLHTKQWSGFMSSLNTHLSGWMNFAEAALLARVDAMVAGYDYLNTLSPALRSQFANDSYACRYEYTYAINGGDNTNAINRAKNAINKDLLLNNDFLWQWPGSPEYLDSTYRAPWMSLYPNAGYGIINKIFEWYIFSNPAGFNLSQNNWIPVARWSSNNAVRNAILTSIWYAPYTMKAVSFFDTYTRWTYALDDTYWYTIGTLWYGTHPYLGQEAWYSTFAVKAYSDLLHINVNNNSQYYTNPDSILYFPSYEEFKNSLDYNDCWFNLGEDNISNQYIMPSIFCKSQPANLYVALGPVSPRTDDVWFKYGVVWWRTSTYGSNPISLTKTASWLVNDTPQYYIEKYIDTGVNNLGTGFLFDMYAAPWYYKGRAVPANTAVSIQYRMKVGTGYASGTVISNTAVIWACLEWSSNYGRPSQWDMSCNIFSWYTFSGEIIPWANNMSSTAIQILGRTGAVPTPETYNLSTSVALNSWVTSYTPGQNLWFDVTYCNQYSGTTTGIELHVAYSRQLPTYLGIISWATPSALSSHDPVGRMLIWSGITLSGNECRTFNVWFATDPWAIWSLSLVTSVWVNRNWSFTQVWESDIWDNTATAGIPSAPTPAPAWVWDKQIDTSLSPTYEPGTNVTYLLTYTNSSPTLSGYLDINDVFDATKLTFVSADVAGYIFSGNNVSWSGIVISPSASVTIRVVFTIKSFALPNTIATNTATFTMTSHVPQLICPAETTFGNNNANTINGVTRSFDLALIKQLSSGQSSVVQQGDTVQYLITIENQWSITGSQIEVVDYIPTGMSLASTSTWWTMSGWYATTTYSWVLDPGQIWYLTLWLTVWSWAIGMVTNWAEIWRATGPSWVVYDIDSIPDTILGNDAYTLSNDDSLTAWEDDSDPASITVQVYDLALIHTLATGQNTTLASGDTVNALVTVLNQGNITWNTITLVSYPVSGMVVNDENWRLSGGVYYYTLTGTLLPWNSFNVPIRYVVDWSVTWPITRFAEIASHDTWWNDVDSAPDVLRLNDAYTSNDDNSFLTNEDDHDPIVITVLAPSLPGWGGGWWWGYTPPVVPVTTWANTTTWTKPTSPTTPNTPTTILPSKNIPKHLWPSEESPVVDPDTSTLLNLPGRLPDTWPFSSARRFHYTDIPVNGKDILFWEKYISKQDRESDMYMIVPWYRVVIPMVMKNKKIMMKRLYDYKKMEAIMHELLTNDTPVMWLYVKNEDGYQMNEYRYDNQTFTRMSQNDILILTSYHINSDKNKIATIRYKNNKINIKIDVIPVILDEKIKNIIQ